jgi:hypothetical protein
MDRKFTRKSFAEIKSWDILTVTCEVCREGHKELVTYVGTFYGVTNQYTFGDRYQLILHVQSPYREVNIDFKDIRSFRRIETHEIVELLNKIGPFFESLFPPKNVELAL